MKYSFVMKMPDHYMTITHSLMTSDNIRYTSIHDWCIDLLQREVTYRSWPWHIEHSFKETINDKEKI